MEFYLRREQEKILENFEELNKLRQRFSPNVVQPPISDKGMLYRAFINNILSVEDALRMNVENTGRFGSDEIDYDLLDTALKDTVEDGVKLEPPRGSGWVRCKVGVSGRIVEELKRSYNFELFLSRYSHAKIDPFTKWCEGMIRDRAASQSAQLLSSLREKEEEEGRKAETDSVASVSKEADAK